MTPAHVLPVEKGERVLDLCAAPGGKSTALGAKLDGTGLLVSNDISASRAKALLKNVEVFGIDRLLVTCEYPEKLATVGEKLGIDQAHRFSDYRELIVCPEVDAVTIATPNHLHVDMALAALAAGKAFDCEKPLGLTPEDTGRLVEALKEKPIPHMINFSYRFIPAARYARDLIQKGKIGKIYHVYAQYFQGWGNSDCARVWRFCREISGTGTLADLGVHMLDLVRFLTGEDYASVMADNGTFIYERKDPEGEGMLPVDVDDYSHFLARSKGGIGEAFEITRFAHARGNYQRVEVYGEKGGLVYSLDNGVPLEICMKGTDQGYHEVEVPEEYKVTQMQTFIDIVEGKDRRASADVADAHYAQCLLAAVEESDRTGRRIGLQ